VKTSSHAKGLDPLGVQAPCIHLYGQLLPGITNVTDRARYYSFYPWLLWTLDQLPGTKTSEELVTWVRRADCLFTMIGIRHRLVSDDHDVRKHDAALIGRQRLGPVVAALRPDGHLRLTDYTVQEDDPRRYFKNPLGGLKQYYLGPLADFGLLRAVGRGVAYTHERGAIMAAAFDATVDRRLFVETVQGEEVSTERLDALARFCPCHLPSAAQEHDALLALFFDTSPSAGDTGCQRRRSLGLVLDLAKAFQQRGAAAEIPLDHHTFRGCVYTGTFPDGTPWELPAALDTVRAGWAVYQRNEMLSVAIQCLFWVALRCLREEDPTLATTEDFVRWFTTCPSVAQMVADVPGEDIATALGRVREALPPLGAWASDVHEVALTRRALNTYQEWRVRDIRVDLLALASRILLSVMARDDAQHPVYAPMALPPDYLTLYPVNLASLRAHACTVWPQMRYAAWLGWLAGYWGIEAHLRVALRKLRAQSQDTFHLVPAATGWQVLELPEPTYTTPRLSQAVQILQDLGAIERRPTSDTVRLTGLGDTLWGVTRA